MILFLQSLPFLIAYYILCVFLSTSHHYYGYPLAWNLRASELCLSFAIEKEMDGFLEFLFFFFFFLVRAAQSLVFLSIIIHNSIKTISIFFAVALHYRRA